MPATYKFNVTGISCERCVPPLEAKLKGSTEYQVELCKVDLTTTPYTLTVIVGGHDTTDPLVEEHLKQLMATADVSVITEEPKPLGQRLSSLIISFFTSHWVQGIGGTASGVLLMLAMSFGGLSLAWVWTLALMATGLTALIGGPSFYRAVSAFRKNRVFNMDTLFAISSLIVVVVSFAAFFVPGLPMMFEAGLLIFGFRHIGLAIEEALKRSLQLAKTFQERLPQTVRVRKEEDIEHYPLVDLMPDTVIRIDPGEIIPVDGVAENEGSFIYDTIKTGEPLPRTQPVQQQEALIAGMRLAENSSPLFLRATKRMQESNLANIDAGIENAYHTQAPIEEQTQRALQFFIPTVVGLSLLSGLVVSLLFTPALAIQCAVSVLVSACPCTLGLIIPLAVKIGMLKAADNGVVFNSAAALENAADIDAVLFDLNGTMTTGSPVFDRMAVTSNATMDADGLLSYAMAFEKNAKHSKARSICAQGEARNIQATVLPAAAVIDDKKHHSGIFASVDNDSWVIGDVNCMDGVELGDCSDDKLALKPGESVVYIARNKQLMGYFVFTDKLREGVVDAIESLEKSGKKVYMFTGSSKRVAEHFATEANIPLERVFYNCVGTTQETSTEERSKASIIEDFHEQGLRVAVVGDGDNDALAMANADASFAMQSRAAGEVTQTQAGAVLQQGSFLSLLNAFEVSKQTVSNIRQNLILSVFYNVLTMLLAGGLLLGVGCVLNPGLCVALMGLQTMFILGNAYRFKTQALPDFKEEKEPVVPEEGSYERMLPTLDPSPEEPTFRSRLEALPLFGPLFGPAPNPGTGLGEDLEAPRP